MNRKAGIQNVTCSAPFFRTSSSENSVLCGWFCRKPKLKLFWGCSAKNWDKSAKSMPPARKIFTFVLVLLVVDAVLVVVFCLINFCDNVDVFVHGSAGFGASRWRKKGKYWSSVNTATCTFRTIDRDCWWTTVGHPCFFIVGIGEWIGAWQSTRLLQNDIQLITVRYFLEIDGSIRSIEEFFEKDNVLSIGIQLLAWAATKQRS